MQQKTVVLLDGGMGQELIRRSGKSPTPMWSAQVMLDQPELVREVHIDFIRAGARVITLNTYSATPERLRNNGLPEQFQPLQQAATSIAQQARDRAGVDGVSIAGCLPPLVASYHPELAPDYDTALQTYRQIVEQQAEAVDCFLCETMASIKEAQASVQAACESGKPVWLALTVADDRSGNLRSGEPLSEALEALASSKVDATLLNCSHPESITASWPALSTCKGPIGAYANAFDSIDSLKPGTTVDTLKARSDLNPEQYTRIALNWVEQGASIIGGCCEIGPTHIQTLSTHLQNKEFHITGHLN